MALHTVALAKKVLLDFFQKIAGPGQSPWSPSAEGEIPPAATLRCAQPSAAKENRWQIQAPLRPAQTEK